MNTKRLRTKKHTDFTCDSSPHKSLNPSTDALAPSKQNPAPPIRIAIIQRVCKAYRIGLFQRLMALDGCTLRIFYGDDDPSPQNEKIRSNGDLSDIDTLKLPTKFYRLGTRTLIHQQGLFNALDDFQPDVIICEAESHFLANLKVIVYRRKRPHVGLIQWTLGGLPGVPLKPHSLKSRFKSHIQKHFDGFTTYSSFAADTLKKLGHSAEKIFIAPNVSDTQHHLKTAETITLSRSEARSHLNLPDRFTVIYAGNLAANKRLDQLLIAAKMLDPKRYNFVLLGKDGLIDKLQDYAREHQLDNVYFPGHITGDLPLYYRAADALILPGRGGMVISEAMAYARPVIVWQADGTEYDLVRHLQTGLRLTQGTPEDFCQAIEFLRNNPQKAQTYGLAGQSLVRDKFTMEHMAQQILSAAQTVKNRKTDSL